MLVSSWSPSWLRHTLLVSLALCLGQVSLAAQANETIDQLLAERPASFVDAAQFILFSAGKLDEGASPEAVFSALPPGTLDKGETLPGTITLGQVCYLVMSAYGVGGGWAYRLFPGPRYATRELAARNLLKARPYPNRVVDGEEVLWVLGAVTSTLGNTP